MSYETLIYREADGVATVTLNRPAALNSFDPTMIDEIQRVWRSLRFNDDVHAVILTGAGEKAFSVGIDMTHLYPQPSGVTVLDDPMLKIGPKYNDMWKPVIVALNGMACGGAFYLIGESEFVIAADHVTLFDPHVTHGMGAVYEPMLMVQRMPIGEVMRMVLLGRAERMSAQRAHQVGLVSEVVAPSELLAAANWAASTIASAPDQRAVEVSVRAVWLAQQLGYQQAVQAAGPLLNLVSTGNDVAETANQLRTARIEPRVR